MKSFGGPAPRRGDIIYVDRGLYKHDGVYENDYRVIHFAPKSGFELDAEHACIQETTLAEFLKNGTVQIDTDPAAVYSPGETVKRARSCVGTGKGDYNLVFHNCEHFARWCKSGATESRQVQKAVTGLAIGAAAVAVTALTVGVIESLRDKKTSEKD
jgi:hypothetical protein